MAKTSRLLTVEVKNNVRLNEIADQFPVAMARALTRTAKSARTMASSLIRERYNIKKQDLDPAIRVIDANRNQLYSAVIARSRRFPLIAFSARQTRKGVTFSVTKGKRVSMRSAFVQRMKSGHEGVFTRVGKVRLPIKERYTISIAEMFNSRNINAEVERFVLENLPTEAEQQFQAIVKGHVKA